ncbi:hypothetical protein LZK82_25530 (plasmid) [Rhizobium leguminosarum]|nr:hypothetical protein LZK82_25530 [Rhizobium leguminosarum]
MMTFADETNEGDILDARLLLENQTFHSIPLSKEHPHDSKRSLCVAETSAPLQYRRFDNCRELTLEVYRTSSARSSIQY